MDYFKYTALREGADKRRIDSDVLEFTEGVESEKNGTHVVEHLLPDNREKGK